MRKLFEMTKPIFSSTMLFIAISAMNATLLPELGAQEVEVRVATESPPHHVGKGAVVQFTVDGLQARPDPRCDVESDDPSIRTQLIGISPRIMQRVFSSGGTVRRTQTVTHTIQLRVIASKPGDYQIGPFVISQNGIEKRVDPISMTFEDVPTTDDMRIKLLMPQTAYPDQRVPVTFEWWFAGDTDNLNSLDITSPLPNEFTFAPDEKPGRNQTRLPIQTNTGTVPLAASVREETVDDKTFTVISAERTLIPNAPGEYEIPPITSTIELVTEWQQRRSGLPDIGFGGSLLEEAFGSQRRPAKIELFRAEGEAFTFRVKPFPTQNQPESFAGGVGKGFSLDVAADRSVVQVGDPIRLTIRLRGDGNIEGAALPSLSAEGGLDPSRFRIPEGVAAGAFDPEQGTKEFVVSIRVLDETVDELPSISYSWFDPESETYRTARSKPIALRVTPATMVGADAVVSNNGMSPRPDASSDPTSSNDGSPSAASSYSLSGADLAIVEDPARLLGGTSRSFSNSIVYLSGYAMGTFALILAIVDRRRREVDPETRRIGEILKTQRQRVVAASGESGKMAAKEVAAALQAVLAEVREVDRADAEAVISECEKIAFRPGSEKTDRLDQQLIDRSLRFIDGLNIMRGAR